MQFFVHNIEVNDRSVELRCYIPEAAPHAKFQTNRPAVIVLPGGAYSGLYGGEAEPIALKYLAQGVCSFVLYYSVKPARFPQALLEGLKAIRYVREHAEEFGIDPARIAVCGFSAGGHLAGKLGTEGQSRGGARHLRHLVQEKVEGPLSVYLLQAAKHPAKVEGVLQDGNLQFTG